MWKYIRPLNKRYTKWLNYFEIKFANKYPNKGPIDVQTRTKNYHPYRESNNGHICYSYFSSWNNEKNVYGKINAIQELLSNPYSISSYHRLD